MHRSAGMMAFAMLLAFINSIVTVRADELHGQKLNELMAKGKWVSEDREFGSWEWKQDGTVCLRLLESEAQCSDTGTWNVKEGVVCYKLSWWGSASGVQENCFTVNASVEDKYETVYHGGALASTMFYFKVVE